MCNLSLIEDICGTGRGSLLLLPPLLSISPPVKLLSPDSYTFSLFPLVPNSSFFSIFPHFTFILQLFILSMSLLSPHYSFHLLFSSYSPLFHSSTPHVLYPCPLSFLLSSFLLSIFLSPQFSFLFLPFISPKLHFNSPSPFLFLPPFSSSLFLFIFCLSVILSFLLSPFFSPLSRSSHYIAHFCPHLPLPSAPLILK